jgi:hypothetical protein
MTEDKDRDWMFKPILNNVFIYMDRDLEVEQIRESYDEPDEIDQSGEKDYK